MENEFAGMIEKVGSNVSKFKVGDQVQVLAGTFAGQTATIDSIDEEQQMLTVLVDFFGRQTPTEIHFEEAKPLE